MFFIIQGIDFMLILWLLIVFLLGLLFLLREEEKKELLIKLKPLKKVKKVYQTFFFELLRTQHLGEDIFQKLSELPPFFSYKETIEKLLTLTREIGASKKTWGGILRHNFQTQMNFQIVVKEKVKEIFFQVFLVYILTYLFAYFLDSTLEDVSFNLYPILFWHIVGLIVFVVGERALQQKILKGFDEIMNALVSFQCLVLLGLSQQRVIEISKISELKQSGNLKELSSWIETLILSWRNSGAPIAEEVKLIQDEAWWQMELAREKFFLHLSGFRLLVLFIFAIPSYFYLIYQVGLGLMVNG